MSSIHNNSQDKSRVKSQELVQKSNEDLIKQNQIDVVVESSRNNTEGVANSKEMEKNNVQGIKSEQISKEDEQQELIQKNEEEKKKIEIEMQKLKQEEADKVKVKQDQFELADDSAPVDIGRNSTKGKKEKGKSNKSKEGKDKGGKDAKKNKDQSNITGSNVVTPGMVKKEVKAAIKQNTFEQKRALEKEFRKKQLEMKKNEGQQNQMQKSGFSFKNLLKDNLFLRKSWRILLLIFIVALILTLILVFYYKVGFKRGSLRLGDNQKVQMTLENCSLMVYDFSLRDKYTLDVNYLSASLSIPGSLESDENIYMQYIYPNAPGQDRESSFSDSEENGIKKYEFNNKLNSYECEIVMFVYKTTQFQSFDINCGDTNQCNIIIYSSQLSIDTMNVSGINVQMNTPHLKANTFNYLSQQGSIEMPFLEFNTASIDTREGDISVQSTSNIEVTFTQKDPYNCFSSPDKITDGSNVDIDLKTYQDSFSPKDTKDCIKIFPWGLSQQDQTTDKIIEYRCYSSILNLKGASANNAKLKASNSYGNIFVNVITEQGKIQGTSQGKVIFNKASKTDNKDNNNIDYINFSNLAQISLLNQTKSASNPKVYDPIFVFDIGPKHTRSSTFQQVQFSYNPAYTYMKPYWLGELTLTLMTTQKYTGQYTISPGFCPYVPGLSLERIHNTQYMITNFMQQNQAPQYGLISDAWQPTISYPSQKFILTDTYNGFKDISLDRNKDEKWIGVDSDQSKNYSVSNYDVSADGSLYAAIIVSCILSGILGIILMVILVFAINQNYIWVLNHIASVRKYASLEKGGAGEIDESTLDIQKRRFYLDYKEQQQMIDELNKKALQDAGENPENEEQGFVPKYTISSIFILFYQLIYLSPPLSAFIDYIVLLLHKAKQNSISEFYKLLFRPKKLKELKDSEDEEIHSLEKDQIQGNEMKQLYEKFCYLNQYLERKFDDEENLKYLTDIGFKIVARFDAQTQFFTYIKYNGTIPTIAEQPNKTSLDLFISSCCSLTKFETDRIESTELESYYQEFCTLNHMQIIQLNEGSLKRDFGIQTIYLPQQWVERDEKFDVQKVKKKYFIDKKRVENNFKILLAKDSFLFSMLYDTEDFKQAQRDIQIATGWQFFDLITVVAHVLVMGLIGCPLIILAIFIRAQQSTYSLIPPMRLIFLETINYYPSSIPAKLIGDNWIVQAISIITLIFWFLSFWDLIYYYASMDFPQEKYFNEYKTMAGRFRKFLSGIMWIIVLISFYTFAVYLSLVAIWLMLSAIINPNAFLPYATSAATFVTLVAKKYKEFQEISQNGFKIISDYLQQMASGQFQDLLKKMNIQDKVADMIPTDTLKDITAEASKLGIIDPSMSEEIQNNLEIMIRDPASVSKLGQELVKISQDPQAFAQQMSQKLEDKAKAIIQQQVGTIDRDLRDELVNLIWCLLKNQKSELKTSISSFVNALINIFQKKQGKQLLKSIGFVNLKGPVFDFIWEFAFPVENFKGNYQDHLINVFCVALSNMITVWNGQLKPIISIDSQAVKKQNDKQEKRNKKNNKKQNVEKTEQELLKEKLLRDMEKADQVVQAETGLEEELEIELTSEEAITYAYKNIIFSVIQICRSISSSNNEIILGEVLNLVQNGSKLPGFDGLRQIKQYQDIFKIGYAIFKGDGEVDFEEVSSAFKGFLKNTGLEEQVKEIAGVGILDVLQIVEVIIQSFKGQSKILSVSTVKKAIQNLLGSIDFAQKRIKIKNQDFQDVEQLNSADECLKMKDDVTVNLNETKTAINDLEQQRIKAKQNEEQYKDKLENSLYYLRYYCKELLQQKSEEPGYNQAKVDEMDYASGEKVIYELEKILEEVKKINLDKNDTYTQQKSEIMLEFASLKKEKADQQEKLNALNEKIDPLKTKIRKNLEEKLKEKTKIENLKSVEISQKRDLIKEKQKSIYGYKQSTNQLNLKVKEKELIKKRNYEQIEQLEKQLNQDKPEEDAEGNAYIPSEGDKQELMFTDIHIRNPYLLDHAEDGDENQQFINIDQNQKEQRNQEQEQENEAILKIKQIEAEIRIIDSEMYQLKQDIIKNENSIKQVEKEIQEIEDKDIANIESNYTKEFDLLNKKFALAQEEDQLKILQEEYEKENEIYEEIVNKISDNMAQQEDIEEDIKSNNGNTNQYVSDTQYYMEEFKTSQKALNKVYQDKIEYHDKIDDLQEKKKKFEKYLIDLDEKYKLISEELKEKNKQEAEEEKKKEKEETQKKEDNDNFLSSGLTIMLNFFSGSISNLQPDLVKELGSFFNLISESIENEEIKRMFQFLKSQIIDDSDDQKGKSNNKGKEKINNFQSILNLLDIFLNDTIIASEKIIKNGKDNLLESEVVKPLQILLTSRFEGFNKSKAIDNFLKGSDLLELISKVMKMKEDTIIGFMEILLGYKSSRDVQTFVNFATSLNKIKDSKVQTLMHLYNLYSSQSPSELYDALTFFQITKNVSQDYQVITVKEFVLVLLFMREQLNYDQVKKILVKLKLLKTEEEKDPKIQLSVREVRERMKYNLDLPIPFKKILEIEIKGYLQANTLQADFKDINRNYEILLEQADFNFFKKLSSIRNIPRIEDPSQNALVKSSITDISEMLNVDYQSIEFFINLLTSSKANKLKQALDMLQILKINPKCDDNDISTFVEFSSSILEKIDQKNQNIITISKNIFSDKLPVCLLRKILYHNGTPIPYSDYLELFNIYCNNQIPDSILNLIDFRYGITGNKKRDIYKFLHPLKENTSKDYQKFKNESDPGQKGLIKSVQILSINEEAVRIQHFLQYLIKTNQDALLMASCLLVYFSGRSSNITLQIQDKNDKNQKVSVEQLLCILLQVKQEFFEAVHTYFQEDANSCTQTMIKFYRQLDYLDQLDEGDENTVLENNITISDKNVEQYVRLVNHMQFNTSFITKDTNIPIEAVELVSNLMYIRNSKNDKERNAIFEQMKSNTYISKLFSQLGVNHMELVTLIKMMYQDYEPTNIKWISKSLKLPPQFKIDGLQQLAMIDQILPIYGESSQNKKQLINLIKTNKFIKNFKIDTTWAEVAYILSKGDFCLLSKYQDVLIPLKYPSAIRFESVIGEEELQQSRTLTQAVNAKEISYISLIQGLTGLLSCRYSSFQTTEFLYQLYTIISQKYVKDEHLTIEDGLKKGNTLQYALYKFTKSTFMSPVWTLLMMGDINTWEFIAQSHYLVNDKKNTYLNPILALVYVLNFRSNPLIVKQLLVDLEYAQRCQEIYIAKLKKECLKRAQHEKKKEDNEYVEQNDSDEEIEDILMKDIKKKNKKTDKGDDQFKFELKEDEIQKLQELKDKIKNYKIQINNILINSIEKDGEKLLQIAEEYNFPKKVINMLLVYENDYGDKKKNNDDDDDVQIEEEDSEKDIKLTSDLIYKAFQPIEEEMQKEENQTKYGEFKELEILNQVFEYVGTDFYTDPRREKMNIKHEEMNFTKNYCLYTHSSSPLMQMVVLSTIAQLKLSYYDFYGFTARDEDHYKQVTFAIDLILCTLEKYYYFDDMMDFFPRHRLIPLIGLSVGFIIESDDILSSMTSRNIFGQRYFQDVIIEICQKVYDKQNDEEYEKGQEQKIDKSNIKKFIDLHKYKLKLKYFMDIIVDHDLYYQVYCNYGYGGVFKGISQSEVLSELENKNFGRLIENYDEMMWDCFERDEILLHITDSKSYSTYTKRSYYIDRDSYDEIDHYSGEKKKDVFEYLDNYTKVAETENFKFMIDIFKENYRSLNDNDYFIVNYGQDSNMFFGTLILNGIIQQQMKEISMEDFQSYVNSTSLYMTSNKKALAEILSLLIPNLKSSFTSLNELLNVSEENLNSFINLAMGKSINQSQDLDTLLKKSSLSDTNKEALKNCVWAYQGEMREHLKLIYHSPLFLQSSRAVRFFTKFLWSFEKSSMHKSANNPYKINYFDFCNLSPNRVKALEKAQQYLWKISQDICYQKWLIENKKDPKKKENSIENYKLEEIYKKNSDVQDNDMSLLLQKILYNDWNFLIAQNKDGLENAFNVIFRTKKDQKCLEKLQILALIKPSKLGLKITADSLDEHVTHAKVYDMITAGGDFFSGDSEARHLHLLLSLSNNSVVHVLNCLNTSADEWSFDYQEELEEKKQNEKVLEYIKENKLDPESKEIEIQDQIFQKYNTLKKEALQQLKNNAIKNESEGIQKSKYLSYILQSLFLWKNISNIKWDDILKNSEAFIEKPYQFKEFKPQIDFLFNYIQYLSILPAVILDKAGAKPSPTKRKDNSKLTSLKVPVEKDPAESIIVEETNVFSVLKKMKFKSLNTEIFTRYIEYESNSIYQIYQSYNRVVKNMGKIASEYAIICEEEEGEELNEEAFKEKLKEDICSVSDNIYFLLNFLNGSFLKELERAHPLIEYLSNLYFIGLQAINTQKIEPITQYLQKCMENENSFIKQILKENPDYATIFNQVLNVIFTISFCTMNDGKIDRLEKENILNQIDDLVVTVSSDLLQIDENITNLVYAVFYLVTNQETKRMRENPKLKEKKNYLNILLKIAFENPDLSDFFFGSPKTGENPEQIDKMISTITNFIQSILDKPSQSINDSDLVKEVLKLLKFASKGNIDVTIIEDVISILTGDHQKVFNILKKFDIIDENKIALIQRAYNSVVDMPIFNSKDKAIVGGSSSEQSDKIKEIVKKLQEGKANIKDVFIAVDAEGDNNGTISIDEFQSFVRRLGMELSRHRVNEIFAYIKNKKQKQGSVEKTDELTLNVEEFEKAFKYVNDKKTSMSLEKLGISPALLVLALGTLIVILILLFVFIFLGINAFAMGGTFGSIINSLIPMAAAGGTAGSQEDKKDKLKEEEVSNAVAETQAIIHSENL